MTNVKIDLTQDVKFIIYDSEAKKRTAGVGEMEIPVEILTSQVALYTSKFSRYNSEKKSTEELTLIARGRLNKIGQDYTGSIILELKHPLSGEESSVRNGSLILTESKGLVAKFNDLKLIE